MGDPFRMKSVPEEVTKPWDFGGGEEWAGVVVVSRRVKRNKTIFARI